MLKKQLFLVKKTNINISKVKLHLIKKSFQSDNPNIKVSEINLNKIQWDEWELWEDNTKQKIREKRINILFTKKMKEDLIKKEIYFTIDSNLSFYNVNELILNWPESWSYNQFRWLMWNYPQYIFWTKLSHPFNSYLGSSIGGNIYTKYYGKILSNGNDNITKTKKKYTRMELRWDKNKKKVFAHIELFKMVIPEVYHQQIEMINHIDNKRENNDLSNLEPSNSSHNALCAHYEGFHKKSHVRISRVSLLNDDDEIIEYETIKKACIDNNISQKKMSDMLLKNESYTHNNYLYKRLTVEIRNFQKLPFMSDQEFNEKFKEIKEIKLINKNNKIITYNYNGYYISKDDAIVCRIIKGEKKIIQQYLNYSGYWSVTLSNAGVSKHFNINRLVLIVHGKINLITFMHIHGITGNDVEYWNMICDHIDENPKNNNINNLQWITPKENTNRSIKHKALMIYNSKKEFVCVFKSTTSLQNLLNYKRAINIRQACRNGFKKTFLNHYFNYISDETYEKTKTQNNTLYLGPMQTSSLFKGGEIIKITPDQMN